MTEIENTTEKSPITRWKRSDQSDAQHVSSLITDEVIKNYGSIELHRLIEVCSASITLYNKDDKAVAFVALCDYPNIPSIMYWWPKWMSSIYGLSHLNPLNTQFIHLMAFDHLYYPEFFSQVMEKIYMDNEFLDFIILLLPPKSMCYNLLNMYFKRVHKLKDIHPDQIRACYVNNRWIHFGKFALKKAGDETKNPIVIKVKKPKSESSKTKFKKVIIQKDGFRTCIIEENTLAGDCICLNTKVQYGRLNDVYDLRTVNGFKSKARREFRTPSASIKLPHTIISTSVEHGLRPNNKLSPNPFRTSDSLFLSDGLSSLMMDLIEDNLRYEDVVLLDPGRLLRSIPFVTRQTSYTEYDSKGQIQHRPYPPSMFINKTEAGMVPSYYYDSNVAQAKRKEFIGVGNAFVIELIMTYNKKARIIDYMRKIFEYSPDNLNFSLMELPSIATPPRILNFFQKFEKTDKSQPCDLYAAHQLAITGKMTVREGWPCDMEDIIAMTIGTHYSNALLELVHKIFFNKLPEKQVFVMLSENLIIGVAVVGPETRIEFIRNNYEIDDLMCSSLNRKDEFGQVIHFIVSPFFYHYVRFFLKEIMRLTGYSSLFFTLFSRRTVKTMKTRTWPCGLQRWVPIAPRRLGKQMMSTLNMDSVNQTDAFRDSFSLFFMNRRIASMTVHLDNRDLVVVGHGVTAMSFIENLVYNKNKCSFNFSNIKLISPDAFVSCDASDFNVDFKNLIPSLGRYSLNYMDRIGISAFMDHIQGRLTGIDRDRRTVEVDFTFEVHYDYLFLLSGTQFTRPDMKKVVETETKIKVCSNDIKGKTMEDYYSDDYPLNLCILDSMSDIDMFINFIIQKYSQFTQEDYLVVYGGRINAWTCLNFLLKYIPGNEIAFVENLNETDHYIDAFNNTLIHKACKDIIIRADVKYYSSYVFSDWEMRRQNSIISKVNFIGEKSTLSLKCVAFVTFSPKTIHPTTIMALNKSGLEFDGKLLIDHKFKTRDPRIYAAGSMTSYSKEYYYDHFNHEYYNSCEVGSKLAYIFVKEACGQSKIPEPEPEVPPLVEMTEPVITKCILPCGINYLKVVSPGPSIPFEQLASIGRISKIMNTGDVNNPDSCKYFRILLDQFDKVSEITCYTVYDIDVISLSRLYGKHEQLLNDLVWRYDNHMIPDFYEFFKQPWASIIYHDRFSDFLSEIFPLHENIKNPMDKEEYLKLATRLPYSNERKKRIIKSKMLSILNKNGLDKGLCDSLMGFLELNKTLLPMYLTPSRLQEHSKDNYFMNQLLEPPVFARDHLNTFMQPESKEEEQSLQSSSGSLTKNYDITTSHMLFTSKELELDKSLTQVKEFQEIQEKPQGFINLTESLVRMNFKSSSKQSLESESSTSSSSASQGSSSKKSSSKGS